ncbi:MAG: 2-succinyl-5-enolpyruvyl-6-hydroxy-3-cyclohexene-1-carboxylic-acid synthase [Myxococcales bacterium]|nr:2-succinyl-5-enolpyruvyl-6-hydroxy-3-cyclohexene-1-carboxylic-acid synthase [Myxococcales bacterium]
MTPRTIADAGAARAGAILGTLVAAGATYAVLSPGSRSTPLVLAASALARAGKLTLHVVLDERVAAFVALGLARASGQPCLLFCTSGSAGAHYLPALVEANASDGAIVAITADRPARLQGVGAAQTVSQGQLYGAHVRESVNIGADSDAAHARALTAMAVLRALGPTLGPVHINVAFEEPLWLPEVEAPLPTSVAVVRPLPGPCPALPSEVAARLRECQRPVIVAGAHLQKGDHDAITALALALGAPVIADGASGLREHLSPELVVTTAEALLRPSAWRDALTPDLVVRVGRIPTTRTVVEWLAAVKDAFTVLIDASGRLYDPAGAADVFMATTVAAATPALAAASTPAPRAWSQRWAAAELSARRAMTPVVSATHWGGAFTLALVTALRERAAPPPLFVASSMAVRELDLVIPVRGEPGSPIPLHVSRGANGIDGNIATATGLALAAGGAVALLGDLAFRHDIGALLTARELGARLVLLVIDNGGGGIFEYLPIAAHDDFTPYFLTPQQSDIAAIARGAGARVIELESTAAVASAVNEALSGAGPTVLVARTDRADSVACYRAALTAGASAAEAALTTMGGAQ